MADTVINRRALTQMTSAEVLALQAASPTTDVATAGRAFGIGSNGSYDLVRRGEFPVRVLRLGRKLRVPTADIVAALGLDSHPLGGDAA